MPQWKVLLLEAGPDENEISDVPSLAAYLQLSKLDWTYKTEPTGRACNGMKNGQCNWPRGKVLGGSSVLNYMLYVRGNRHDYNHWEALGRCLFKLFYVGFQQVVNYVRLLKTLNNSRVTLSAYDITTKTLTLTH